MTKIERQKVAEAIERELRRWDGLSSAEDIRRAAPDMAKAIRRVTLRALNTKPVRRRA